MQETARDLQVGDGTAAAASGPMGAANDGADFEHHRLRAVARVIFDQDLASIGGNVAAAALVLRLLWSTTVHFELLALGLIWGLWCLVMLYFNHRFRRVRDDASTGQFRRWVNLHRVLESGLCCNFSAGIFLIAGSGAADAAWVATLAGALYTCAESLTVSWDLGSFFCTVPVIVFTAVWIQWTSGSPYIVGGLLVFLVFAYFSIRELQTGFERSIRLSFENLGLARKLGDEKAQAVLGRQLAEAANAAKSRFFAAANHDLRQPLHALSLGVHHLRSQVNTPELSASLQNTELAVLALNSLFNQLMELSRIDNGNEVPAAAPFALHDLFETLRGQFSPQARDKRLRLVFRPAGHWACSDRLMVERILVNLIGNALKFTGRGSVVVACRPMAPGLRIQVWDTGVGIPQAELDRIFEEFYQIDPNEHLRGQAQGLGLGLSICRRLSDRLGSRLRVRSQPGRGSVFEFDLPAAAAHAGGDTTARPQADARAPAAMIEAFLQGRQVALLEDDDLGRKALVALLQSWGAIVDAHARTETLRERLDSGVGWPDILIADYQIGNQTSEPLLEHICNAANNKPAPRIVAISGTQTPGLAQRLERWNVALLHKPVQAGALRDALI